MATFKKTLFVMALTLVASFLLAGPSSALPDTTDDKIQVIQHNTDMGGPQPAMQAAADWGGVDAITFQELCGSQRAQLEAAGYNVFWKAQRGGKGERCRKGNAIASVHAFTTHSYKLITRGTGDAERRFKLLCVDLRGSGVAYTTVCTAHFPLDYNGKAAPTGEQNRITVANKIRRIVNAKIAAGRRVVLTGDFNDDPRSAPLDRFYRVNGNGRFWEGDQKCGTGACRAMDPTTDSGRRLDYFFASSPGVDKLGGVSKLPVPAYDPHGHFVIRGSVKFGSLR